MSKAPDADATQPRRRPRRRSARELVTALLDAAEHQLIRFGLAGISTNQIASRAGVSIGSLYQYFPNKQAVLAEAARRLNRSLLSEILRIGDADLSPHERFEHAVTAFSSGTPHSYAFRGALIRDVPRAWLEETFSEFESGATAFASQIVGELAPELPPARVEELSLTLVFAVRGAVQGAILHQPEMLSDGRIAPLLRGILDGLLAAAR